MTVEPNELPPPMPRDPNYLSTPRFEREHRSGPHVIADVILHEGQVKEGRVQGYTIRCDEAVRPDGSGGTGTGPSPLGYFTSAIGF